MVKIVLFFNGKNSCRIVENERGQHNYCNRNATEWHATQWHRCRRGYFWGGKRIAIEDTVVGTPANILNDEIISTLEKNFETISESIESRFLNIE